MLKSHMETFMQKLKRIFLDLSSKNRVHFGHISGKLKILYANLNDVHSNNFSTFYPNLEKAFS